MHELAVTESLLEISLRHAKQANAVKITMLNLVIGDMASIVDDSLQFYWGMIAAGTIAEGAVLNFKRVPAQFTCLVCLTVFSPDRDDFCCPACQSTDLKLTAGSEFFLESIEIDNELESPNVSKS